MLRSYLCDCSDAYIAVKGKIIVTDPNNNVHDKKLVFKNNALFVSCISKINNALIDDTEDVDIVVPTYNLLEYNKNYSKTTGSFWNYYRDEPNKAANNNINYSIKDSKSFDYKTSITGKLESNNTEKETGIVAPLKHLSNFWRIYILGIYSWNILLKQLRTGFKRTINGINTDQKWIIRLKITTQILKSKYQKWKLIYIFKFSKIFREQLSTFSSNNV